MVAPQTELPLVPSPPSVGDVDQIAPGRVRQTPLRKNAMVWQPMRLFAPDENDEFSRGFIQAMHFGTNLAALASLHADLKGVHYLKQASAPQEKLASVLVVESIEDEKRLKQGARDQFKAKFKKTELCKFWFRGKCLRDDKCMYAHGESELNDKPNLEKTILCRHGKACQYTDCKFAHSEDELRSASFAHSEDELTQCEFARSEDALAQGDLARSEGDVPSTSLLRGTAVCRLDRLGLCALGDACRNAHIYGVPEASTLPKPAFAGIPA